jgi:hypothetical protein
MSWMPVEAIVLTGRLHDRLADRDRADRRVSCVRLSDFKIILSMNKFLRTTY